MKINPTSAEARFIVSLLLNPLAKYNYTQIYLQVYQVQFEGRA